MNMNQIPAREGETGREETLRLAINHLLEGGWLLDGTAPAEIVRELQGKASGWFGEGGNEALVDRLISALEVEREGAPK